MLRALTPVSTDSFLHKATHYTVPQLQSPFTLLYAYTLSVRYTQHCDSPWQDCPSLGICWPYI